jgi:hypothetical protein
MTRYLVFLGILKSPENNILAFWAKVFGLEILIFAL